MVEALPPDPRPLGADPATAAQQGGSRSALRWLLLAPLVVFALLAGLFALRLASGDPSKVPSALIGRPVPAFALEPLPGLTAEGKPVPGLASGDLKGRVTVVNVWASWCAPCRQEHPALMELARDTNARRFLGSLGNPFAAVGVDPRGRTAIDWGVYGVPETFVVGPDGTIRYKHIGPLMPEQLEEFRAQVRAAQGSS